MAAIAPKSKGWEPLWDLQERQNRKSLDQALAKQEKLAEELKSQNFLVRAAVRLLRPIVLFIVGESRVKASIAADRQRLQDIDLARTQGAQK